MVKEELDLGEGEHPNAFKEKARPGIYGVFSTVQVEKIGTGTTTRKSSIRTLWFAEQNQGVVELQPINSNNVPSGPKLKVLLDDFVENYDAEPEVYHTSVYPKMQDLETTILRGERGRARGALYTAEHEFSNALGIDLDNVRANFGLGLTYIEMNRLDKAEEIFRRLIGLDATFSQEHKHLFNEFGISLRRAKFVEQSVEYYSKALELAEEDEHLHYNVARAFYDRGDMQECREHLRLAMEINEDFPEARNFIEVLDGKKERKLSKERKARAAATRKVREANGANGDPSDKCYVFDL